MWYFLISVFIMIVVLFITCAKCEDGELQMGIITLVFIILVAIPIINLMVVKYNVREIQEVQYTITGLEFQENVNDELKGCFILGSGKIEANTVRELKYVYFINTEYGKQLHSSEASKVYIKETDNEAPKLVTIKRIAWRYANIIDKLWGHDDIIENGTTVVGEILVVPTNTIKIDYNIEI